MQLAEVQRIVAARQRKALRGQNLNRLNLSRFNLSGFDLTDAELRGAVLSEARLEKTILVGADLSGAVLTRAALGGADLSRATLAHAELGHAKLAGATLKSASLELASLVGADLSEAMLTEANLARARLDGANLSGAALRGAEFVGARLAKAVLVGVRAQGADFDSADLSGALMVESDFSDAVFEDARLERSDLKNSLFSGADLRDADLSGADVRGTTFSTARYNLGTTWPHDFSIATAGAIFTESESELDITTILPGKPYPLGATWDGYGVNFSLYSRHARRVELCLFERANQESATARIILPERTHDVWHVYLPDVRPGQLYGYRVHGPYRPEQGLRFNANKLLLDPYAKAIAGELHWDDALFGYKIGDRNADLSFDTRNSARFMPKSIVVDPRFDWEGDQNPETPLHKTILYELHVKGFTQLREDLAEGLRGTYAGLASPACIKYLKELGITAVELMPVHHFLDDRFLVERDLRNYWGYNTLSFFAPDPRYSSANTPEGVVQEFKSMVKALHAANIEVILDVVYNHTAEGNHLGPTLSLRGIDNASYYRLVDGQPRYYMDYTGCGNTLNALDAKAVQLIMDSLRYWVTEMHVDGFRFDLAAALMRGFHEADRLSAFMDVIAQDPVLSQVKLIAEPWDLGPGGYRVGNFPVGWSEWNGRYRDTVRRFWKGDESQVAELAYRLTGSSDLYQHNGRRPVASINFVTAHDGFTLKDLVSYNQKHNEANKDDNRDGHDHNDSWNCGVEGPTDDPEIKAMRARQMRNFMATLLLSQGVPMLLMGDERCRTQLGNNNTYCQDSELSWLDWSTSPEATEMLRFTKRLIALRNRHPILHRRRFFSGRRIHGADIEDIIWVRTDGHWMTDDDWQTSHARCFGMLLNGEVMTEWSENGEHLTDDVLLVLMNAYWEELDFELGPLRIKNWRVLLDTSSSQRPTWDPASLSYPIGPRSLVVLAHSPDHAAAE